MKGDEKQIIELVKKKELNYKQIAELLEVTLGHVKYTVEKYGLRKRGNKKQSSCKQKYKINEEYFDTIDTSNKAYLLGLIIADGWTTVGSTVGLTLKEEDKYILEFLKKELESEHPITKHKKYNANNFGFSNIHISDTLKSYGIVPNKSLIIDIGNVIEKAKIPNELISCVLLGYYDGDGCIYHYVKDTTPKRSQYNISITGTLETCQYFKSFFDNLGFFTKRHKENNNNNYTYVVSGVNIMIKCLDKLYNNLPTIFLQRKYHVYLWSKSPFKQECLNEAKLNLIIQGCKESDSFK